MIFVENSWFLSFLSKIKYGTRLWSSETQIMSGFFYSKVEAFLCQEKLKFSDTPHLRPLQLHFMPRIIKRTTKNELQPNRELFSKKTLRLPNIECGFRHLIHSKKERWFRVFSKMLLSLPKLAVKNNSSKKHAQMRAKNTPIGGFSSARFAQGK